MESTNILMDTSKPAQADESAFLSALAFLVPVGRHGKWPLFTGLAIIECESNSIPLLTTLEFLETMHHGEVFVLILKLVQLKSIKQLQAKHTS
jgi:hypothetical protein